jgi:hypothetical protein
MNLSLDPRVRVHKLSMQSGTTFGPIQPRLFTSQPNRDLPLPVLKSSKRGFPIVMFSDYLYDSFPKALNEALGKDVFSARALRTMPPPTHHPHRVARLIGF